jgi:hypothetical protein
MNILTIVPSRGRPDAVAELIEDFNATTAISNLVIAVDDDDTSEYVVPEKVILEVNPRMRMNGTLNFIADKYCYDYDYLVFMGDDHRPRTQDWDLKLAEAIKDIKHGIAYGNDLLQGENLPTAVMQDSSITRTLGYFSPPKQRHLFLDNFWKDLGTELGTLRYVPEVILEHLHPFAGKSEWDERYVEVNDKQMYIYDQMMYQEYRITRWKEDLAKLRAE